MQYLNPEMEWITAAHNDNMSYDEFRKMPVDYQELMIAHTRVSNQISAVLDYDSRRKK